MEGWRMILLVNGGLCFFMAFSAWGLSQIGSAKSDNIAGPMRSVAIALVGIGLLLLILGLFVKRGRAPQP